MSQYRKLPNPYEKEVMIVDQAYAKQMATTDPNTVTQAEKLEWFTLPDIWSNIVDRTAG